MVRKIECMLVSFATSHGLVGRKAPSRADDQLGRNTPIGWLELRAIHGVEDATETKLHHTAAVRVSRGAAIPLEGERATESANCP